MSARVVLAAATLVVLGACVYLFLQVRATPAAASGSPSGGPVARIDDEPAGEPASVGGSATVTAHPTPTATPTPTPTATGSTTPDPGEPAQPEDANPDAKPYRLDAIMDEANKAFDRMDFDEARAIAQRVLKQQPNNVRMLRIMVSSACIEGDGPEAQKHYNLLPAREREQMKTRCMRYQVQFTDPPEVAPSATLAPAAPR